MFDAIDPRSINHSPLYTHLVATRYDNTPTRSLQQSIIRELVYPPLVTAFDSLLDADLHNESSGGSRDGQPHQHTRNLYSFSTPTSTPPSRGVWIGCWQYRCRGRVVTRLDEAFFNICILCRYLGTWRSQNHSLLSISQELLVELHLPHEGLVFAGQLIHAPHFPRLPSDVIAVIHVVVGHI